MRRPGKLRSSATEFFRLEDDHVLVDGLQCGVGDAGCTIEDRTSYEHHVTPFDEWATRHAVEERFLVEAARVEVWIA